MALANRSLGDGLTDPPPIGKLLRPAPVDNPERAGMADGENAGLVRCNPGRTGGIRNALGRFCQCEYLAHRAPSAIAHPDHDRRLQVAHQRAQMLFGAGADPARTNSGVHRTLLDAENGVRQKHRCGPVELRRLGHAEPGLDQQLAQIVVGLVIRLVMPAIAHEIPDIAEILADSEKFGPFMAEPQFPMADDFGIEVESGAAANFARAAFDTNPAGLAVSHERAIFLHAPELPRRRLIPISSSDRRATETNFNTNRDGT